MQLLPSRKILQTQIERYDDSWNCNLYLDDVDHSMRIRLFLDRSKINTVSARIENSAVSDDFLASFWYAK